MSQCPGGSRKFLCQRSFYFFPVAQSDGIEELISDPRLLSKKEEGRDEFEELCVTRLLEGVNLPEKRMTFKHRNIDVIRGLMGKLTY
jgi:hypothetical protein